MRIEFRPEDFNVALASSVVVFGFDGQDLQILLAKKTNDPFSGAWILPSTVVNPEEAVEDVASQLLCDVTGREEWYLEQLNAFAKLYRNPSGRVVNVAFYALTRLDDELKANLKRSEYSWCSLEEVPSMAFDHNEILEFAKERLKRRVKRRPIGFRLLPKEFTLLQLQRLYECALGKSFDKRNFRRKILKSALVIELDKKAKSSPDSKKPANLYSFNEKKYRLMSLKGYDFVF